eukprot:CAMPEP_0172423716 /NCGR_PEP_ID=MMETSP1064-20121228/17687_1 /TAXON_ID=202472 /ORGANISM="Aulacoseira subarctica , Strain CCAP 1002/5" /LENGTH=112 /DNA_ID=CAMNT_0013165227 /DNA_START=165 /DNA_END=503 /DNA_ORIENTATION=-
MAQPGISTGYKTSDADKTSVEKPVPPGPPDNIPGLDESFSIAEITAPPAVAMAPTPKPICETERPVTPLTAEPTNKKPTPKLSIAQLKYTERPVTPLTDKPTNKPTKAPVEV